MLHHYAAKERILFELAINATTFFAFPPIINILGDCESGRSASTFRLASVRTPAGSPSGCRSVKMSNEAPDSAFPRTKIQFRGFRGPSRAIRKIHIVAWREIFISPWRMKAVRLHPSSVHDSVLAFHLLPSDLLTSPSFQRAKLQIFAFHSPKIWLPRMKQYCLGGETILFDLPNTSVWLLKQYRLSVKM